MEHTWHSLLASLGTHAFTEIFKKKVFLVHSQVAYRGIYVHIFVCVVLIHVGYKLMVENTRSESTLFGICVWVGAWALSGDRYTSEKSYIKIGD